MNKYLDNTIDAVGNSRFFTVYSSMIREFTQTTPFIEKEVTSLLLLYHKFVLANRQKNKFVSKIQMHNLFLFLFKVNDIQIIERILLIIAPHQYITPAGWMKLFTVFMSTDIPLRISFAFEVYDTLGLGYLRRDQITLMVEKFFTGDNEDEVNELRQDMVETIFNKFDVDKDGIISFDDYTQVATKDPNLIEFLGKIFPNNTDKLTLSYCCNFISYIEHCEGR